MTDESDVGAPRYLAIGMHDLPERSTWLTEPERERLDRFRFPKRREESRLGRWTAKHTLAAALGTASDDATLRGLVIRNASDGAPEVFLDDRLAPIAISMTDRADWAVCTVLRDGRSIGCDLEVVEPRSAAFVRDWFTASEQTIVARSPDDHDLLANLVWSAKESALKVLRTGLRRDTRSVEVRFETERVERGWRGVLVTDVSDGREFSGWWRQDGDFVLSFVSTDPTPAPVSLVDPPPLESAVPQHRWFDAL